MRNFSIIIKGAWKEPNFWFLDEIKPFQRIVKLSIVFYGGSISCTTTYEISYKRIATFQLKQGPDLIELRLTNWKGGMLLAFGSLEYLQMSFLDDLEHLIEHELCENIQILDVPTKLGFWPSSS